jgi:hypothetical protein
LFCAEGETDGPTYVTKRIFAFRSLNKEPKYDEFILQVIVFTYIVGRFHPLTGHEDP